MSAKPLFNLSHCIMFCAKKNNDTYEVGLLTNSEEFLSSTQLRHVEGNVFVPDGIVARRGFGRSFHRLLVDIATDLGGSLAIVRDGDARGGAMTVWQSFYNDPSLEKIDISDIEDEIDWTNPDDNPELFHAYRTGVKRYVEKSAIRYTDTIAEDLLKYVEQGFAIFDRAYDLDCNKWIDEELPLQKIIPLAA